MSADGSGIIGAVVLALAAAPVLVAGAAIAGAVYGTAKLIEHTSNVRQQSEALRKEQERKRAAELAKKTAEERRRINEVLTSFNLMQEKQAESRKRLNQKFASELTLATSELESNQRVANANMIDLVRAFEQRSSQLFTNWKQSSEQLQSAYSDTITASITDMKQKIEQGRSAIASLQCQYDDDRKKEYAKAQIEAAKDAIIALETELGASTTTLVNNLNRAIDYYNQDMFDNAYSIASAVMNDCYDDLASGLKEREKMFSLLDMLETKAILQKARIASAKHFTFEYKGESYEEDLTRFSPEIFSAINDRLSDIEYRFTAPSIPSLISASHELDEIEDDIDEIIKLSATKLLYAYTENDTASDITSAMESQGFEMEGYAYENDVEGNSIHINYVNTISNERVTVVLTPSSEGIRVDVHNYGTKSSSGQEDVSRQDGIRRLIENTLKINISCTNRGKSSTNTSAANLDEVKRLR